MHRLILIVGLSSPIFNQHDEGDQMSIYSMVRLASPYNIDHSRWFNAMYGLTIELNRPI